MPILRKRELRKMSREDRDKRLEDLRVELSRLKTNVEAGGTIENPARIREMRRTIARILTVKREMGER